MIEGLLIFIVGVIVALLVSGLRSLLSADARGWTERGTDSLLAAALRRLPTEHRERYRDEWEADLATKRKLGPLTALAYAAKLRATVGGLARELVPAPKAEVAARTPDGPRKTRPWAPAASRAVAAWSEVNSWLDDLVEELLGRRSRTLVGRLLTLLTSMVALSAIIELGLVMIGVSSGVAVIVMFVVLVLNISAFVVGAWTRRS
jgi:hypothetical protein